MDGILFSDKDKPFPEEEESEEEEELEEESEEDDTPDEEEDMPDEKKKKNTASMLYSPSKTAASFLRIVSAQTNGAPIEQLEKRLELLKY